MINLVIILLIMTIVAMLTQNVIKELTLKDIQNVARLTQTNIYAEISQAFVEPVNTSLIMARNVFVEDIMHEDTPETEAKIAAYLSAIQDQTGYDSVFIVPHSTLSYYHPGGTDAKVDLESESSFWYTALMDLKEDYLIVVNTEQLDNYAFTVYVDAILRDEAGSFAGTTGVGTRITHLLDTLSVYEKDFEVQAYIVNHEGLVLIHKDEKYIREQNLYDIEGISESTYNLLDENKDFVEQQIGDKFFIVQHIPMLDWYLVVTKETSELGAALNKYSMRIYITLVIAAFTMLVATRYTISRYKKQIIYLSNIDQLTDIPNRTIFDQRLKESVDHSQGSSFCLALYDLDNLKQINDVFGHDKGDEALTTIAEIAKELFLEPDFVSRIGGDEFAIIIHKPIEETLSTINVFHDKVQKNLKLRAIDATVSIGITESNESDIASSVYKRADIALYQSKRSGKNMINIYEIKQ